MALSHQTAKIFVAFNTSRVGLRLALSHQTAKIFVAFNTSRVGLRLALNHQTAKIFTLDAPLLFKGNGFAKTDVRVA
ncbi:MAG TPA: type II toxin-antitoxin system VapC family toxin [Rhizomicrobium sp.]|nr:type II toxin-antitoxin system VapC family toxin [Rhizomicrobium sp.]